MRSLLEETALIFWGRRLMFHNYCKSEALLLTSNMSAFIYLGRHITPSISELYKPDVMPKRTRRIRKGKRQRKCCVAYLFLHFLCLRSANGLFASCILEYRFYSCFHSRQNAKNLKDHISYSTCLE